MPAQARSAPSRRPAAGARSPAPHSRDHPVGPEPRQRLAVDRDDDVVALHARLFGRAVLQHLADDRARLVGELEEFATSRSIGSSP